VRERERERERARARACAREKERDRERERERDCTYTHVYLGEIICYIGNYYLLHIYVGPGSLSLRCPRECVSVAGGRGQGDGLPHAGLPSVLLMCC